MLGNRINHHMLRPFKYKSTERGSNLTTWPETVGGAWATLEQWGETSSLAVLGPTFCEAVGSWPFLPTLYWSWPLSYHLDCLAFSADLVEGAWGVLSELQFCQDHSFLRTPSGFWLSHYLDWNSDCNLGQDLNQDRNLAGWSKVNRGNHHPRC